MYRVYDDRTNETLYENESNINCILYVDENFDINSTEIEHVWIEKILKER